MADGPPRQALAGLVRLSLCTPRGETPVRPLREYLVNIDLGRGTAQKRVTGGRWRRIVLGDVLAGHVVALGGSPRVWSGK